MKPRARWMRSAGWLWILLAAAVAVAPQMVRGNSCGHDFDFHLVSWLDCLDAWRHGVLYPHWAESANFGAGEPRFIFYPPLTWMLGAALGAVLPWVAVPVVLTFLLLAGTGLAVRALARQALDEWVATLAGCAALFSGYALFTAYERSAFGELTGGFWIPLVLLLLLRDRRPLAPLAQRALDGSALPLALVVAGAWLSNAPVGVMACYLAAAVALAVAVLHRSWAPVLRAAVAVALGLGLASFYILPAAWEQRWVEIQQATDDPGLRIENSWLFARHADPRLELHDMELLRVSLVAAVMLCAALAALVIVLLRGKRNVSRRWLGPLVLVLPAVMLLQLPISLPVWNLLPKLRFLQFPWRWLVVLEAPMAILLAMAVAALWPRRRWLRGVAVAACVAAFVTAAAAAGFFYFQGCDDEDAVAGMLASYRSGAGFEGVDEYAPPGADNALVAMGLPAACLVSDPTVPLGEGAESTVPAWDAGQASCAATFNWSGIEPEHRRLLANLPHAGTLVLRLRSYPAWTLAVNGRAVAESARRADGLVAIAAPAGAVEITATWRATADVRAGRWLSLLALALLAGLGWLERRLRRAGLS